MNLRPMGRGWIVTTFLFLTYAGMRCLVESPILADEVHDSLEYHQIAASAITATFFYGGALWRFVVARPNSNGEKVEGNPG